jgi:hypothetical protein
MLLEETGFVPKVVGPLPGHSNRTPETCQGIPFGPVSEIFPNSPLTKRGQGEISCRKLIEGKREDEYAGL